MKTNKSQLQLKNGQSFIGLSPDWQKENFYGEVVFTTGMTSYVETLTDPSYSGQIITFTYPLIGNYGVPSQKDWESKKIYAHGVVVSEACENWSHVDSKKSLLDWLEEQNVPIIIGVDTRALTKMLREHGVMLGVIDSSEFRVQSSQFDFVGPNEENLVAMVSCKKKKTVGNGKKVIFAVDCGMKENIMRHLLKYDLTVHRVPYNYDYTNEKFDGVFLSNGPGDPMMAIETVKILKKAFIHKKPIFGICLGSQLMGLACGAKTYKLPYGHRGQNQPCIDLTSKRCYITSQNHGYAIREKTLPKDWQVTYKNLNDGSVEGISHKKLPFFSVQFHPEAAPGPTDTAWMFEEFYKML